MENSEKRTAEEVADLVKVPVQEVEVKTQPTNVKTKVGTDDFVKDFIKLVKTGNIWRTAKSLAEKLGVDPVDLTKWMDGQTALCRKPGKEDGVIYYAPVERLQAAQEKRPPGLDRKAVEEADRYMVGCFSLVNDNLWTLMEKYGLRLFERQEEAFKAILQARDRLDAGLALIANKLGTDRSKLP